VEHHLLVVVAEMAAMEVKVVLEVTVLVALLKQVQETEPLAVVVQLQLTLVRDSVPLEDLLRAVTLMEITHRL
jgi:hypothetical protein